MGLRCLFLLLMVPALEAQTLTITGGVRSGTHVFADPDPEGQLFDRWSGETAVLVDPLNRHTTLNALTGPRAVTALFRRSNTNVVGVSGTINGSNYTAFFPMVHKAVVFRFHGTGGTGLALFRGPDQVVFNRDLADAGYAIVALDSVNRVDRQWDTGLTAENPDVRNVVALIEQFTRQGQMRAGEPTLANGISNGGAFVTRITAILNWKAGSNFISQGVGNILTKRPAPTIWGMAANDDSEMVGGDGNARAIASSNALLGQSVLTQLTVNAASPVHPLRFWWIEGLTADDSRAVYASVQAGGALDGNDYLKQNPATVDLSALLPVRYRAYANSIQNTLAIAYARHHFFADTSQQVVRFFDAVLAGTAGAPAEMVVASAATFSANVVSPGSIAAVFRGGFAAGQEPRVLVRDAAGVERAAQVYGRNATQINFVVPEQTAAGTAGIAVETGGRRTFVGLARVAAVAPGLFAADASGTGLAAANLVTEPSRFVLSLYGTGIQGRSGLEQVRVVVGGVEYAPLYAGAQGEFAGLDQVNVLLPRTLNGRLGVARRVDGVESNMVVVNF